MIYTLYMKFSVYIQYGYYELLNLIEDCMQNNYTNYNKYQKRLTDEEMDEEINKLYEKENDDNLIDNPNDNPNEYLGLDYGETWEQV
jgi:hypothetical protein